ncbi:hypothetical protein Tco_0421892 [Tanacetum coccineum]
MFIDSQFTWDYDSQMTEKYFTKYTGIEVKQFRETLLQHMGNVKKPVAERTRHKRQYDIRVSKRQMQTHTSKVDSSKALDADLVAWKAMGQNLESRIQAAPIEQSEPIYDTYLLEKIDSNTTPDSTNISHSGGEIDQDAEQYQVKSPLFKAEFFKMKDMIQDKVFANAAMKNELRKLKGNSVNTKFAKPSILGNPVLQPLRNHSVVRQPTGSERPKFSKPQFASHVNVNNDFPKPVTPHYLPKVREFIFVKPHHVIASGSSRNRSKKSYGSNGMAHKYYLEVAKKKTQDKNTNLKPSVMHTTSLQNCNIRQFSKF